MSFPDNASPEVRQLDYPFPVVNSATLGVVRSRLFRGRVRAAHEIPEQTPGTVLIFQNNDRFSLQPSGPQSLASNVVVEATAVAVVSMRQELVPVAAKLPSADLDRAIVLRAVFRCKVLDPVLVLESGCWSVEPALTSHLLDDSELRMLGAREDATSTEVARHILARVTARNDVERPLVPGMVAEFVNVDLMLRYEAQNSPADPLDAEFGEEGFDGPEFASRGFLNQQRAFDPGPYRLDDALDDGFDDGRPNRNESEEM